ncbi:MAG: hypothetical protein HC910_10020 [Spirulinaceae cyanobacterium SM2_1_0]|nr:hypothetical protein [Spirulinaceae cyanobacterium SM2_1_0]
MGSIVEIVRHAMHSNHLSAEAEHQLRNLLRSGCTLDDTRSFTQLQAAIVDGWVTQESRERWLQQTQRELAVLR